MRKGNLHTHTVFCDGKDTPEELVLEALRLGCDYIGFSGHSRTGIPEDEPFCMSVEGTESYKAEICRLKRKYEGKIDILMGIEQDYYSVDSPVDYEFVIGSVHYIFKDGVYLPVDVSKESQLSAVNEHYGGDVYSFIEDYYTLVGDVYRKTGCDIIGHFDLVTKFNEDGSLFDTSHPRYVRAADRALNKLLREDVAFEINYGAVGRGYRKTPYPEERILNQIEAAGKKTIRTSDCHNKDWLLLGSSDYKKFRVII